MEYVPATNCIWVLRAGGSSDVGVYDLDTDTWGILKMNLPDGSPLNIDNADIQLVGTRMYVFAKGQTGLFSFDASLDGAGGCPADFNDDGTVDFFDYDDFVQCFEGGACPPGQTADFNDDGSVDFFDYDDFVLAFETPC
jgi:hypothetical protein